MPFGWWLYLTDCCLPTGGGGPLVAYGGGEMLTPPALLVPLGQASCFVKQGKFQQAEQLYKEILSLQDQELSTPRAGKSPALGSPFPGGGTGRCSRPQHLHSPLETPSPPSDYSWTGAGHTWEGQVSLRRISPAGGLEINQRSLWRDAEWGRGSKSFKLLHPGTRCLLQALSAEPPPAEPPEREAKGAPGCLFPPWTAGGRRGWGSPPGFESCAPLSL